MTQQQLENKIKSLTPKGVIMAMVEGLRNPFTDGIVMSSYGMKDGNLCYGCAATNAVCYLNGGKEDYFFSDVDFQLERLLGDTIAIFERAINQLRLGKVEKCNQHLMDIGIRPIIGETINLAYIADSSYTKDDLETYIQLASMQLN